MKRTLLVVVGAALAACGRAERSRDGARDVTLSLGTDALSLRDAVVVPGAGSAPGALYFTLTAREGDTLRAVAVSGADAMLHDASMAMIDRLALPAGQEVRLSPGGMHAMFTLAAGTLAPGDSVAVTFTFARAGTWPPLKVKVVDYADLDSLFAPNRRK